MLTESAVLHMESESSNHPSLQRTPAGFLRRVKHSSGDKLKRKRRNTSGIAISAVVLLKFVWRHLAAAEAAVFRIYLGNVLCLRM